MLEFASAGSQVQRISFNEESGTVDMNPPPRPTGGREALLVRGTSFRVVTTVSNEDGGARESRKDSIINLWGSVGPDLRQELARKKALLDRIKFDITYTETLVGNWGGCVCVCVCGGGGNVCGYCIFCVCVYPFFSLSLSLSRSEWATSLLFSFACLTHFTKRASKMYVSQATHTRTLTHSCTRTRTPTHTYTHMHTHTYTRTRTHLRSVPPPPFLSSSPLLSCPMTRSSTVLLCLHPQIQTTQPSLWTSRYISLLVLMIVRIVSIFLSFKLAIFRNSREEKTGHL